MYFANSFEVTKLLKYKENRGRHLFIQKLVWCLDKEKKSYMLKHFYDEDS